VPCGVASIGLGGMSFSSRRKMPPTLYSGTRAKNSSYDSANCFSEITLRSAPDTHEPAHQDVDRFTEEAAPSAPPSYSAIYSATDISNARRRVGALSLSTIGEAPECRLDRPAVACIFRARQRNRPRTAISRYAPRPAQVAPKRKTPVDRKLGPLKG
jgi:hypothetical protein